MIQDVESVHAEVQRVPLMQVEMFCQSEIPVLLERPTESISWNGAKAGGGCGRSGIGEARRTVRHHRRWRKACRIEIRHSGGDLALDASWVVSVGQCTAQEDAGGG